VSSITQPGPATGEGRGRAGKAAPSLPCRIRLTDGRSLRGQLPAARHRTIHIGLLHAESEGFVEVSAGVRTPDGPLELDRRSRHFYPAGRGRGPAWLHHAEDHAKRIVDGAYLPGQPQNGARAECFIGVTPRSHKRGTREQVVLTRWLWVDVDDTSNLGRLYTFLTDRPCQLLIESAGSGGVHAYWKLARPLPATHVNARTGELTEPIERANLRLVAALGADRQCVDRNRVLRLAGTPNWKTGRWARIVQADLGLPSYELRQLVGDLPDPELPAPPVRHGQIDREDPYRGIPAAVYMARLAGLQANRAGFVSCPSPTHPDPHPSCHVGGPDPTLFKCFACGAAGGIYDLASIVLGGAVGRGLRGEDFRRARALVMETFGELPRTVGEPQAAARPAHTALRPDQANR
jgi:hypothetical protein